MDNGGPPLRRPHELLARLVFSMVIVAMGSTALAAPKPYLVEATWGATTGPISEQDEWNYVVGQPARAVFLYDPTPATVDAEGLPTSPGWFEVTDNPVIDWNSLDENGFPVGDGLPDFPNQPTFGGVQRRFLLPSSYDPTSVFNPADPHHGAFGTGINGINYFFSNGLTFRRLADASRPMQVKLANDHLGLAPGQLWDTGGWEDGVASHQGPAGMQLVFIDPTGTTSNPPTSLTSSLPWPSLDTDDYEPTVGWALAGEGNLAFVSEIREIDFGDTDGNGEVVGLNFEGDFEALEDNYNKAAGTYGDQTLVTLPNNLQVEAYPLGIASWRDGDFNVDGLVDKDDLAIFNANFVLGNVNYDNQVNIFDVGTVSDNWMSPGPRGDANADGEVNIFDVGEISDHWLDTEGAAQAVPEPQTWLLLATGLPLVVLVVTRRRRSARR